ncbi:putative metalloprotease [Hasllibacter halocynthiae]|uniref:Putative metalloprotease n=1 Tax=Hasllibacter halocynthiae TaxID=595589 RepID=A0A2T0X7E4_9RHOB|nr:M48 family metallopeptidase [Hasllibacter halocynthiae]PRY94872.1 putative metalloprotease [Hasllibacter halocynthiae]
MLKLTPILLAIGYALLMYRFSAWRTRKELDAKSTELADRRLLGLLSPMAEALDVERVRVMIYEIDPVNGLAAPDGRIFVTRGFLQKYQQGLVTAEELASVIAHEIGHVALGHSRRRMIDFSGQNAIRVILMGLVGRFVPLIGPLIANAVVGLVAAGLSRKDEYEADAYATALLVKSGIDTAAQKSLFRKLEHLTGGAGGGTPAWLLTHPKVDERIAAIEANERRWGLD